VRSKNGQGVVLEKILSENNKRYLERVKLYKNFGYDIEEERKFILEKSQPLYGDILEVGTGKGYFTTVLAKEGYKFVSIDISEQEQKFAELNIRHLGLENHVDFKVENAEQFSFEDKSFDIVLSVNMIHHITNISKIIDEFVRVVSFEGKIILSDFTKAGLDVVDKVHRSEGRRHGFTKASMAEAEEHLKERNFTVEKYRSNFQEILIGYHPIL